MADCAQLSSSVINVTTAGSRNHQHGAMRCDVGAQRARVASPTNGESRVRAFIRRTGSAEQTTCPMSLCKFMSPLLGASK